MWYNVYTFELLPGVRNMTKWKRQWTYLDSRVLRKARGRCRKTLIDMIRSGRLSNNLQWRDLIIQLRYLKSYSTTQKLPSFQTVEAYITVTLTLHWGIKLVVWWQEKHLQDIVRWGVSQDQHKCFKEFQVVCFVKITLFLLSCFFFLVNAYLNFLVFLTFWFCARFRPFAGLETEGL